MSNWRPATTRNMLVARADLYRHIRDFFQSRGVLEVDTPLLARSIGTDPHLQAITARYQSHSDAPGELMYLQTSPEFAMKRLLAAGSGPVFQLCKAFRNGESGRRHNPEFTMLEWYRPGFSLEQLMAEVEALAASVLALQEPFMRCTYASLFKEFLGIDPHQVDLQVLLRLVAEHAGYQDPQADRDTCLELLYSQLIEPRLQEPVLIIDYPASQAALSKLALDAAGNTVARRFELVIRGMEIANGYDELQDVAEQRRRFELDQAARVRKGLATVVEDQHYLAALEAGLPDCAGVALGVDRLLMLLTGAEHVDEVLAFPLRRT
jgi:elongation factor P--(R)-beta-lysine ligase